MSFLDQSSYVSEWECSDCGAHGTVLEDRWELLEHFCRTESPERLASWSLAAPPATRSTAWDSSSVHSAVENPPLREEPDYPCSEPKNPISYEWGQPSRSATSPLQSTPALSAWEHSQIWGRSPSPPSRQVDHSNNNVPQSWYSPDPSGSLESFHAAQKKTGSEVTWDETEHADTPCESIASTSMDSVLQEKAS